MSGFKKKEFSDKKLCYASEVNTIFCMKLSKKLFIAVVATIGTSMFLPSVKANDAAAPSSGAFKLDAASFGLGVTAPTVDVGNTEVKKGTFTYRTSVGTSDNFSVGTVSAMGASTSASSTPDYDVNSAATFNIATSSQINQAIGSLQVGEETKVEDPGGSTTTTTSYWGRRRRNSSTSVTETENAGTTTELEADVANSGSISGTFTKTFGQDGNPDNTNNNVTVDGVGTSTVINLGDQASFKSTIAKVGADTNGGTVGVPENGSAGTANGSANGSINTSTSASASNSQFVSSFIQAY